MKNREVKLKPLAATILSLSLLTVMAGAAVAPALEVIREYFSDASKLEVQLIVSMPALFIVITNMFFGRLAARFGSRTLTLAGLALYTAGGAAAAGLFDSIWAVLTMRALVGVGVGIIMPLSTGLLTYYFPPERREGLMGLSSAANQLGGVVATLLAGVLANISWRLSFLVYLMGLISIVLCLIFMPNDRIRENNSSEKGPDAGGVWRRNWLHIVCMFLLMTAFFIYPANFAIVTAAEGVIPMSLCAVIMAGADLVAFGGGLAFVWVKRVSGKCAGTVAPTLFLLGYCLLAFVGGWVGTLLGSAFVGFANGVGVPYIISSASANEGKAAATTVMPLISASLYLSQFLSPFILSLVSGSGSAPMKIPYYLAAAVSAVFLIISAASAVKKA